MAQIKITKSMQRVLDTLTAENRELNATQLAELAKINAKNLSKITKPLVEAQLIIERPEQDGQIRTKYYSINPNPPEPEPIVETPEPGLPEDRIPLATPEKLVPEPLKSPVAQEPKPTKSFEIKLNNHVNNKRISEILSTQKPNNGARPKIKTDYYLKTIIIKSFEDYLQQFDEKLHIISE